MSDGLSEGDIVLVDFEAWTDEGDLFDTTRPDVAEDEGWEPDIELQAMPVLLGGRRLVPGFEDALLEAEIGEETETEVPPEKGFGEHDPDQVRVFPRKEFEKADIDPIPGNQVEISNERGVITQATASRVRVDFNHPMAGRTLTYKFNVVERVEDPAERVRALLGIDYQVTRVDDFEVEVEGDTARISLSEEAANDPQFFMAKHRLGHDLFEHTELETVELVETMTRESFEEHSHGHGMPQQAVEAAAEAGGDADVGSATETEA